MQILNKKKNIYYLDFDGVIADSNRMYKYFSVWPK